MEDVKKMSPEILKAAYEFGSEAYWAMRANNERMPDHLMDKLIAIADKLLEVQK